MYFFYRLIKLVARYSRDLITNEIEKCIKDTTTLDGDNCVEKALNFCLELKGDEYKDKKEKF